MSTDPVPANLEATGSALWVALARKVGTPTGVLALEACRIADRLDQLDKVIRLDQIARFVRQYEDEMDVDAGESGPGFTVVVVIDKALGEARQQAATLKTILEKLGLDEAAAPPAAGGVGASPLASVLALVQSGAKPAGRSS